MTLTTRQLSDMIVEHEARLAKLNDRLDDINAKLAGDVPIEDEEPADAGGSGTPGRRSEEDTQAGRAGQRLREDGLPPGHDPEDVGDPSGGEPPPDAL